MKDPRDFTLQEWLDLACDLIGAVCLIGSVLLFWSVLSVLA